MKKNFLASTVLAVPNTTATGGRSRMYALRNMDVESIRRVPRWSNTCILRRGQTNVGSLPQDPDYAQVRNLLSCLAVLQVYCVCTRWLVVDEGCGRRVAMSFRLGTLVKHN